MREAMIERKTNETEIRARVNVDGRGTHAIETGIGFFDHMLAHVALHGLFDVTIEAKGDLHVDVHHMIEDCALVLGQAFDRALGERKGIVRIGSADVPMDEALARVAIDLSGRPYAVVQVEWHTSMIGQMPVSLVTHFFESFAVALRANVHAHALYGRDDHHQAEALFKALGRALDAATQIDARRVDAVPSTKGRL